VLIEQVALGTSAMGVSELARRTGMPKTSAHRTLEALVAQGLLTRQPDGYVLGREMRRLAQLTHDRVPDGLRDILVPFLVELYERTGDVVTLGVLDSYDVLALEVISGRDQQHLAPVGARVPAHCSAIGKVLLAHRDDPADLWGAPRLPQCTPRSIGNPRILAAQLHNARRLGVAMSRDEQVLGWIEVAMPVLGLAGPVAGIGRSRSTGTDFDRAGNDVHREIAIAASTAVRRSRVVRG
jgi:DNA-binding IclR family transcriptional regulator